MNLKDKKLWIIGLLLVALGVSFMLQNSRLKKTEQVLEAYDKNAVNSYAYLMATTNFKPAMDEIKKTKELESIDDKILINTSDSFNEIINHLMQLNILRGYSDNADLLKNSHNKVRGYSYTIIYKEQDKYYGVINNIYKGFEELLMDMYQNGVQDLHKTKMDDVLTDIGQIEGIIKSSVNRNTNPNDLQDLRAEFKRVEAILDKIEAILE